MERTKERKGASSAAASYQCHSNDGSMIAKERVDSRINSRPFSSFLFHRRCSSTYATRSKLEFLPSVSVFRHIRNETKSTGPLIIETVRDKLSRRGGGEREREKEGTEETRNLAGGFHHRRDGTRRLQDVSDLSIFSTRSTMNDPVSEPLLGQT